MTQRLVTVLATTLLVGGVGLSGAVATVSLTAARGASTAAQQAPVVPAAGTSVPTAGAAAAVPVAAAVPAHDHGSVEPATVATRRGPRPRITITTTQVTVPDSGVVRVRASCSGAKRCTGTRSIVVGSVGPTASYAQAPGTTRTWSFTLTAKQLAATPATGSRPGKVRVKETRPKALAARTFAITLTRPAQPPVEPTPGVSEAYANRNWTPTAVDTCPASLHRSYSVVGPDGKLYPTWHPPQVVDPATGETCTFGHEHGDDPASSDIYDLVSGQLGSAEFPDQQGVPFGYVSEQLTAYAGEHAGTATRHEDNVGHKIIVENDVKLVRASPRGFVTFTDDTGAVVPVTCDYLMKIHQGSHSADATTNNAHELVYAVDCNDGTRLVTATMTRFGDPNEFNRSCEPTVVVPTSGSTLPAGDGGQRRIPDRTCVERHVLVDPAIASAHSDPWGIYELWESANTLHADDGSAIATFDPWFGVRNPARYFTGVGQPLGSVARAAWDVDPTDNGVTNAIPWLPLMDETPFAASDLRSPFTGTQRDFYLGQTDVTNAGGSTTWYTDPYGDHGGPVPFVGSVAQLVASRDSAYPVLERRIFDQQADFGAGQFVHAPN